MNELANKIQMVLNTLEDLDIKATNKNMNQLLGCQNVLSEVRDTLLKAENDSQKPALTEDDL